MRVRYFEPSIISPEFTVWPHWLVPPPRAVTARPSSRASASAVTAPSMLRGTTTPAGII